MSLSSSLYLWYLITQYFISLAALDHFFVSAKNNKLNFYLLVIYYFSSAFYLCKFNLANTIFFYLKNF